MDKKYWRAISKANSLANWSFIGILFPIVGWILVAMSGSVLKQFEPETEEELRQYQKVDNKRTISLVVSIIVLIVSVSISLYVSYLAYEQQQLIESEAQTEQYQESNFYQQWQAEQGY